MTETVDEAPSACPSCPNCKSEYSYQVGDLKVCTECAYEWAVDGNATQEAEIVVDAYRSGIVSRSTLYIASDPHETTDASTSV